MKADLENALRTWRKQRKHANDMRFNYEQAKRIWESVEQEVRVAEHVIAEAIDFDKSYTQYFRLDNDIVRVNLDSSIDKLVVELIKPQE